MDFKAVISILLKRFDENQVHYGLIGGFALGLWGGARTTVDLDFLVDRSDMDKVDSIMREMGYENKFRSENVSQYVSPSHLFGEVDFLHAFRQASREMLRRAVVKEVFNGELSINRLLKKPKNIAFFVMPVKSGIQKVLKTLDSRFRGNDDRGMKRARTLFFNSLLMC